MADNVLAELEQWNNSLLDSKQSRLLRSLIKMYGGPHSRYLNFYGPPGTVHTASYHQIVRTHDKAGAGPSRYDFRGKAVFVGLSERLRPEQKDGFHTVFSQPSGVDISGVEVAATAFGNLLEDMPVQPLRLGENLLTIFLWGMLLGMGCHLLSPFFGALGVVGVSALYVFIVLHQFKFVGEWFPLTIPLLFQSPFAFFGGVIWKYFDTNRERQNIRKAFGYYLPDKVVDQLTRNLSDIKSTGQVVYGTCLFTDAEQYTTLSETMGPNELHSFMNKYFEALFEPVTQQGGIIAEVFGDGMLALWSTPHSDVKLRHQACLAALSIGSGVNQFNQSSDSFKLPTRIGLHSGYMFLGHVGAVDHYEYRPTGDIVNTASRIEGLNKYLRTRILVSQDVLYQLEGFLTRELGRFLLVGKSNPLTVYDLICRIEDSDESQRALCLNFGAALSAYKRQAWKQAIKLFNESTKISDEDGPSVFYLRLCERYRETPPGPQWDGVVQIDQKIKKGKSMKQIRIFLPIFTILLSLSLGYVPSIADGQERCEEWIARVVSVQGTVEARRAGDTQWLPVAYNDTFCPGDMIQLQELSRAAILLPNETILRLDQKTTVTFTGLEKTRFSLLDLLKGAVHFFSRTPRGLKIATPFVNGYVEGTEFFVKVEPDQTYLSIFEGRVLATNEDGSLLLTSGQSATTKAGQAPELRMVLRPRDSVQWALYYPPIIDYRSVDFPDIQGTDWEHRYNRSVELYTRGDIAGAISSLQDLPEEINEPRFSTYRAGLLLSVGRFDEASTDIERALNLDPTDSHAIALQSIIALAQNDKEGALDSAQNAAEADPHSSIAQIALSYAQQAKFDLRSALRSLQEAVRLDSGNALAWARLAELWLSLGYLDKSLEAAQKAVSKNPNLARAQTVLGFAYLTQTKTRDAKKVYEKAIELDQADPLPRLGLGLAKIRDGDVKEGEVKLRSPPVLTRTIPLYGAT